MKTQKALLTALAAGAGYMALRQLTRPVPLNLEGKIVFITGGSRGLGLALAREFATRGALVTVCARDAAELQRARESFALQSLRLHTFVCDITDPEQVRATVSQVISDVGLIDILVNNAGMIRVGPFEEMTLKDFEDAMEVMFWGPLHTTLAVLPDMRLRKRGSIVNITSVGGKVPVPHLLPYSCAKFAAVALSEGMRTELAPAGIRVTTIAPGLMRTGSHLNAEFKGRQSSEYAWFAAGAASPVISISAQRAAREIVRATIYGESERVLSVPANVAARIHGLLPGMSTQLMSLINRLLPGHGDFGEARPGREMEAGFNSRLWKAFTKPGQEAAERLNEIPVHV